MKREELIQALKKLAGDFESVLDESERPAPTTDMAKRYPPQHLPSIFIYTWIPPDWFRSFNEWEDHGVLLEISAMLHEAAKVLDGQ